MVRGKFAVFRTLNACVREQEASKVSTVPNITVPVR